MESEMPVKINITTMDGEVLDIFTIEQPEWSGKRLADIVHDYLSLRFNIPEDAAD